MGVGVCGGGGGSRVELKSRPDIDHQQPPKVQTSPVEKEPHNVPSLR